MVSSLRIEIQEDQRNRVMTCLHRSEFVNAQAKKDTRQKEEKCLPPTILSCDVVSTVSYGEYEGSMGN